MMLALEAARFFEQGQLMSHLATVLLAEDDEDAVLLLRCAFEDARLSVRIVQVGDGEQAIHYLSGSPPYADRLNYPFPKLLLLDLAMPKVNGFEVLSWLRARPELAGLPVIVLTTSTLGSDSQRARELGASDYIVKPLAFESLVTLAHSLHSDWIRPG